MKKEINNSEISNRLRGEVKNFLNLTESLNMNYGTTILFAVKRGESPKYTYKDSYQVDKEFLDKDNTFLWRKMTDEFGMSVEDMIDSLGGEKEVKKIIREEDKNFWKGLAKKAEERQIDFA